ncbi:MULTISPECIES: LysM peptidoglycan-binding domain-containing protein [Curtobacterium]|uniref:LysM peptidoglycan-binding domain-containing protein n=1 Tax=Curtobacterium flaccumfaciens TaxID=2035 RepID=UPI003EE6889D
MDNAADEAARRARSARFATMPIVLAGTIAVTAGLTGPVAHVEARHDDEGGANKRHVDQDRNESDGPVFTTAVARPAETTVTTVAAVTKTPTTYTVRQGDTVSAIAARYGLSAQEVLVRNGLGWNTIIHPGQTLHLASTPAVQAAPARTTTTSATGSYHVRSGDTVSGIASRIGVSTQSLLRANNLSQRSVIYPGQTLRVPSSSAPSAPASAAPARPASTAPSSSGHVKIASGDTIASIAAAHHVSVKALLAANGLSYTSTIYAGKTLVLPGATATAAVSTSTGSTGASVSSTVLSAEQWRNAATIVSVGRSLGVPQRGLVVALAAAMQESSLRNLSHGDRDSVGLFQQRPSQGWGSAASLQDPATAAKRFFAGNPGKTRGLLGVFGWASMSVTDAAQAVQVSAYPTAYAKWAGPAETWLASL